MAKKKNAPILRAQGGGGDEPATKTVTKSYAVRDKWLDKAKDNLVEFKSVDGEISDLKVNGEPAGGGGGGASLVKVSIINNTSEELEVQVVHLIGDTMMLPAHLGFNEYIDANSTLEIDAVTLGEYSKIIALGKTITAVTGEITKDSAEGLATIHGPGTVTITA